MISRTSLIFDAVLYLSSAARIVILDSCTVVAQGSLQELRDSNLDVARYVGEEHYAVEDNQVKEEKVVVKPATPTPSKDKEAKPAEKAPEKDVPKVSKWAPYIFYIRAVSSLLSCTTL